MFNMLGQLDRIVLSPQPRNTIPKPHCGAEQVHPNTQCPSGWIIDPAQGIEEHEDRRAGDHAQDPQGDSLNK